MPVGPPPKIVPQSLDDYLEIMSKSVFQSGMSWKVIEAKWPSTREAFRGFDIDKVANLNEEQIDALAQDPRVVRNYRKLAAIVSNAQKILELDKAYGSFQQYLRAHGIFDHTLKDLPPPWLIRAWMPQSAKTSLRPKPTA